MGLNLEVDKFCCPASSVIFFVVNGDMARGLKRDVSRVAIATKRCNTQFMLAFMHTRAFARNIHLFRKIYKITLIHTQCTHVQAVPKLSGTLKPHLSIHVVLENEFQQVFTREIAERNKHMEYIARERECNV